MRLLGTNYRKLRYAIAAGYLVPIGLSVLSAIFVWRNVKTVNRISNTLQADVMIFEKITRLALSVEESIQATKHYLLVRDPAAIEAYERGFEEFLTLSEILETSVEDRTLNTQLDLISDRVTTLDTIARESIALVQNNRTAEAVERWTDPETRTQLDQLNSSIDVALDRATNLVGELEDRQQAALDRLVVVALTATGLSLLTVALLGTGIAIAIAKKVNQSASTVARSVSAITTAMEQQERAATQQAISVHETSTTMDELETSARQVMEQVEAAASRAREVLHRTEIGTQTVTRTVDEMTVLKDKTGAIARQIFNLSEQTSQIGNISTLVSDLSARTHMLALNAAVEAVRAGEHGKGFSIVATEIRQLADESRKSTEKINMLVADIQRAIDSTVLVIGEGTQSVDAGVQISRQTSEAFVDIQQAIGDVVLNNQQISLNIKQQVSAVQQVVEAMNVLNASAQDTAKGITQVKLGTQRLNEAAADLEEMV
ncbi:MAG: methyl-accepting chemotaxis protein [Cyanobacteriota bacterium]|nr:methyl-accepting chemotaxis protein [Cyanobacteriota bacterium]